MTVRADYDRRRAWPKRRWWEVVVIGAGPAGSMAARELARRGHEVLLLERARFPRYKVCGGCLSARAISVLEAVGLGHVVSSPNGQRLTTFRLHMKGRCLQLPLEGMWSVCRRWFDDRLVEEAVAAGVTVCEETEARFVEPDRPGPRASSWTIGLYREGQEVGRIAARAVVLATGLAPRLPKRPGAWEAWVDPGSRIGIGACLEMPGAAFEPGVLFMGVGATGYVGVVHLPGARLNVAATVSARSLRAGGRAGSTVERLMADAGLGASRGWDGATWKGTPLLTRRTRPVARDGLFAIGDAAEYVEPFTGEGMAAALIGGAAVVPYVRQTLGGSPHAACRAWCDRHHRLVTRQHRWCRRLAWVLRHARLAAWAAAVVRALPALSRPVLGHLQRRIEPEEIA